MWMCHVLEVDWGDQKIRFYYAPFSYWCCLCLMAIALKRSHSWILVGSLLNGRIIWSFPYTVSSLRWSKLLQLDSLHGLDGYCFELKEIYSDWRQSMVFFVHYNSTSLQENSVYSVVHLNWQYFAGMNSNLAQAIALFASLTERAGYGEVILAWTEMP